jgi:hypothetical protein
MNRVGNFAADHEWFTRCGKHRQIRRNLQHPGDFRRDRDDVFEVIENDHRGKCANPLADAEEQLFAQCITYAKDRCPLSARDV